MFGLKYLVQLLALVGLVVCFAMNKYMEGILTFCMATTLDHIIDITIIRNGNRK